MPELPEVEVIRQDLSQEIDKNSAIKKFIFYRKDIREPIPIKKITTLEGATIKAISRRAKYLIFETSKGYLISHLGMSGNWRIVDSLKLKNVKHDHVEIHLNNGKCFVYNDPRRFGIFGFSENLEKNKKLKELGPEPWSSEFSTSHLREMFKKTNRSIKVAVMDPKVVVGVGNIYASEILFAIGVKPTKKSQRLTLHELEKLIQMIRQILTEAIQRGGSSIKTFQKTNGQSGSFQNSHKVYGRMGDACFVCDEKIRKIIIAGRSSFWCPGCQR